MLTEIEGVVFGAVDEGRSAAAQELRAEQIGARRAAHDAAVVLDPLVTIEYRKFQPGVVGPVTAGPDDRADLAALQIDTELRCSFDLGWFESVRSVDVVVESCARCPLVDRVEQAVHLQIGERTIVAE